MDLLDLSLTDESSVLTKGEMSFTLYANTNKADARIIYCYLHDLTSWPSG